MSDDRLDYFVLSFPGILMRIVPVAGGDGGGDARDVCATPRGTLHGCHLIAILLPVFPHRQG